MTLWNRMRGALPALSLFALLLPGMAFADVATATDADASRAAHPPGVAVASAHGLATQAGLDVLAAGGNAFDAAVAVSAVLSVVEPISSGLGGGGLFLLHDARSGADIFVDARETAPRSATPEAYLDKDGELDRDRATNGPWSAGIPGLPAALVHMSAKYGKLPLAQSLAPAIRIAREGFEVYPRMARGFTSRSEVMRRYPGTRAVFMAGGRPIQAGDTFRQPDLARTLEAIAARGHDGFYKGEVARRLIAGVRAEGGRWQPDELAGYQVVERAPIRFGWRGWEIVTAPPPSSGGVAIAQMLQMLAPYDFKAMDEAARTHLIVEAMRRAFRDRTFYLGDPDFVRIPMRTLTSADYAAGLRATINPDKATPSDSLSGQPTPLEDEETTHFSIIDAEGNRVGGTQTVNLLYGSGLIPPGTGVLLNNEMDDFALRPGTPNAFGVMGFEANAVVPGKRMLSSMTPTFMVSPDRIAVLGTPGGSRIITMVLLGVLGYDAGLDAQAVAALPRIHHQWWPDSIDIESGALSAEGIAALRAMGHTVAVADEEDEDNEGQVSNRGRRSSHVWGNFNTVAWDRARNVLEAGSDPRHPEGRGAVVPSAPAP